VAKSALSLSAVENEAVSNFLAWVRSNYSGQPRKAMLFGSKARGEATADSDIDILLIVTNETWQFKDEICKIISDISLIYDVLLDVRVIGQARWQYMSEVQAGLYRNISREAIPIAI